MMFVRSVFSSSLFSVILFEFLADSSVQFDLEQSSRNGSYLPIYKHPAAALVALLMSQPLFSPTGHKTWLWILKLEY